MTFSLERKTEKLACSSQMIKSDRLGDTHAPFMPVLQNMINRLSNTR